MSRSHLLGGLKTLNWPEKCLNIGKSLMQTSTNLMIRLSIGCLWVIAQLPMNTLLTLGEWCGIIAYHLMQRRTQIARANIQLCFPELTNIDQEALTRECIIENTRGLFESAKAWWGNMHPIFDEAEVHGLEIIQNAACAGHGVLLIGAHYTTLDMGGRIVSNFWPINILYRPFDNPIYNRTVMKARAMFYNSIIDKSRMRDLVRQLQAGGTLWYPADQDYGPKDSVFAPFFDIPAATLATTAGLAKICRGQVVGLFHHRLPDNRYRIEFKAMPNFPVNDSTEAATLTNAMIEEGIRLYPAQYMWVHRRFKTRPQGQQPIYSDS